MTATEMRKAVRAKYETILGRNVYSQTKRDYCFKKASDGKYYSDCSSSVSYTYKEAGYSFGIYNTVGLYTNIGKKFTEVPVKISKGQITNPEVLRIGDMLLYAGTDKSRAYAGYVGHVEMYWGADSKGVHWVVGHGSGNPKKTKMTSRNSSRYASKTSTKVGNKGLIKVIRWINDDGTLGFKKDKPATSTTASSASSASKPAATTSTATSSAAKSPTGLEGVKLKAGDSWNLRALPDVDSKSVGTVKGGATVYPYDATEWNFVTDGKISGWIHDDLIGG